MCKTGRYYQIKLEVITHHNNFHQSIFSDIMTYLIKFFSLI